MIAAMSEEVIAYLGRQNKKNELPEHVDESWGRWLVSEAFAGSDPYLQVHIASRRPIIGIGAPAEIFIKRIAALLHTSFILPDYAPVANAVGAVAGSVIVEKEAIVYARENSEACEYVVQIDGENTDFAEDEDALDYAEQAVTKLSREAAVAAGAINPQVMVTKTTDGHLQRIVSRGIGNPQL
jgi:N-methylhydantoinase A/oxoprolinase/acetone carboxylase beta subunit